MACGTTAPVRDRHHGPLDGAHVRLVARQRLRTIQLPGSRSTTCVPGWRRTSRNTVSPYEPLGYLRYVAFSSRFALDVENGEESRT